MAVAPEFEAVGTWSSAVAASRAASGDGPGDAPVAGRVCTTPSFVTLARNHTTVRPVGAGRSEVTFSTTMETNVIGKIMGTR